MQLWRINEFGGNQLFFKFIHVFCDCNGKIRLNKCTSCPRLEDDLSSMSHDAPNSELCAEDPGVFKLLFLDIGQFLFISLYNTLCCVSGNFREEECAPWELDEFG